MCIAHRPIMTAARCRQRLQQFLQGGIRRIDDQTAHVFLRVQYLGIFDLPRHIHCAKCAYDSIHQRDRIQQRSLRILAVRLCQLRCQLSYLGKYRRSLLQRPECLTGALQSKILRQQACSCHSSRAKTLAQFINRFCIHILNPPKLQLIDPVFLKIFCDNLRLHRIPPLYTTASTIVLPHTVISLTPISFSLLKLKLSMYPLSL